MFSTKYKMNVFKVGKTD